MYDFLVNDMRASVGADSASSRTGGGVQRITTSALCVNSFESAQLGWGGYWEEGEEEGEFDLGALDPEGMMVVLTVAA